MFKPQMSYARPAWPWGRCSFYATSIATPILALQKLNWMPTKYAAKKPEKRTMIRLLFILVLLSLHAPILGQKRNKIVHKQADDLSHRIAEINTLLKVYGTLSPFSAAETIFKQIDSISKAITSRLLGILNDNRIIHYPIETLLNQDEIFISKSSDNRLYFFSIDEKTGGSYRPSITILHYRPSNGNVKAEFFGEMTYGPVFLLDSLNQQYFVVGSVQTCSSCLSSSATVIKIDTSAYQTESIAEYEGRYTDLKVFEYDSVEQVFSVEYDAADHEDSLYGGHNEIEGYQHTFKSKFKFIHGAFLEIEKCEVWEEKE